MKIHSATYERSVVSKDDYPDTPYREIVLSGRSNVGKSSFINSLLDRKQLAYTSSKPGKTQTLNFYLINESFYFVDVPGYGYAKVSKTEREKFGLMIDEYLRYRTQLTLVVLLVDFRHNPTSDDILMYDYLKSYDIPCLIVATKLDKIPKTKRLKREKEIKKELGISKHDLFMTYSSITKENKEEILSILDHFTKEI